MNKIIGNTVGTNMNPEKIAVEVPKKLSEFENDVGYVKDTELGTMAKENKNNYLRTNTDGSVNHSVSAANGRYILFQSHYGVADTLSGVQIKDGVRIWSQYGGVQISDVKTPTNPFDAANKGYVDTLVGDIETALDGIIALQNSLIGGETV